MLKIGIVGLANVGKSTLFNALTNAGALAANYPFATIEPNVGIVPVPDERLTVLAKMYATDKVVPAAIEFVDIAGLIAGASQGEGLGNKFLAHIREVDAICHVVRAFEDSNVVRVGSSETEDIETVNTELMLADSETMEKVVAGLLRDTKSGDKGKVAEYERGLLVLEKLKRGEMAGEEGEEYPIITSKPVIYVFNCDEALLKNGSALRALVDSVAQFDEKVKNKRDGQGASGVLGESGGARVCFVNAKLEEEMSGMDEETKKEFLASYEIGEDGLAQLVRAAYDILGLQSFLTAGKKEVRAWTVAKGATAPEAAGAIHTDFERGFIAASVVNYEDLVRLGSEKAVRGAGLLRTEGKTYVMREGDVVEFRFNV